MIPQNNKSFFKIEKDNDWRWSIKISFNLEEEIDFLNLFLIIKSYINNDLIVLYSISTNFYDTENKYIITQKETIKFFKKINFDDFMEWVEYRLKNDWKYDKITNFYSILLVFNKKTVILQNDKNKKDVLDELRPIYPWRNEWLNFLKKEIDYIKILEKKIEYYEKTKNPDK